MTETAVGLFQDHRQASAAAAALHEIGMTSSDTRVITEASASEVITELKSMGATDREIEWYRSGLRRGNTLVFATGTTDKALTAIDVMNEHDALSVEEFELTDKELEPVPVVAGSVGGPNVTEKIEHHRNRTEGAKIFAW